MLIKFLSSLLIMNNIYLFNQHSFIFILRFFTKFINSKGHIITSLRINFAIFIYCHIHNMKVTFIIMNYINFQKNLNFLLIILY